ncbi:hypothetical protein KEJ43_01260 [Candidatus Bathyarchaeota archaeon]|nr:hypothetical protein [Candidatus Bathyarchaeota archaeon]
MSVNNALREIETIEGLIGPYEYFSYDAKMFLNALRELREAINVMDKAKIKHRLGDLSRVEEAAAPYRGYGFVEEAIQHSKKLLEELKKIVGE